MPRKQHAPSAQLDLFEADSEQTARIRHVDQWPAQERFPINLHERTVAATLHADLEQSDGLLAITGYSSLEYLIATLGALPDASLGALNSIRLLFGNEPEAHTPSTQGPPRLLPEEMRDYWLERGISIHQAPELLRFVDMIRAGRIQARYIRDNRKRLHAKIYVTDASVITGSSNFSHSGMRLQHEFNCRFSRTRDKSRYEEAARAAENFWRMGDEFTDCLLTLLEELLRVVSFEEAVARACAELLEGEWARRFLPELETGLNAALWPTQIQGIGRALWIIDNQGSCLVADATGAGKTRMGAHLLKAIVNRMLGRGRLRYDQNVLVCPPGEVERSWNEERARCGLNLATYSHGLLSRKGNDDSKVIGHDLRRAQCIAIDEAHNFLNPKSSRTRRLLGNMADHVVLFTATPINRGVRDLIAIVELLGADNLDDKALKLFDELGRRMRHQGQHFILKEEERRRLRSIVGRFTLRRTKQDLKREVARNPGAFTDANGNHCTYPEHQAHTYATRETKADQELAMHIRELASRLRGLVNLQKGIHYPEALSSTLPPEKYVDARLKSAAGLAQHHVMAALRSSRLALAEHILGTEAACRRFGLAASLKTHATGDMIHRLQGIRGQIHSSNVPHLLPEWLRDKKAHAMAVAEEIELYRGILEALEQMSDARDIGKAEQLLQLHRRHAMLIAFDSCLITLAWMQQLLEGIGCTCPVHVATGQRATARRAVSRDFALGSKATGIALCSDALAEGINLQQASAVVMLDMPSVIRIAEQRIGRVDRLNSPHAKVEIWWPKDSDAFALRTDAKFVQRHHEVASILGANIELPESLMPPELLGAEAFSAEEMISRLRDREARGETWDGLEDAFQPVRELVDGERAIVPAATYEALRRSKARVLSVIAVMRSSRPWAFFAISGQDRSAPKWVYLDHPLAAPVTSLEEIAARFRLIAAEHPEAVDIRDEAAAVSRQLSVFRERLDACERLLLPRRKQRALDEMEYILGRYLQSMDRESREARYIEWLLASLRPKNEEAGLDLDAAAECWMDLIRDAWFEELTQRRRRTRPLRMRDLRQRLLQSPIPPRRIIDAFRSVPQAQGFARQSVVTLLGLPG